ncbi:MAG: (2Fe-2S)-binding protein [Candidatus Hydrogenedentes bacterium]|nr:(2Fe-2S)-binding protein [Candidatus Hydrogenedentota bacterium]
MATLIIDRHELKLPDHSPIQDTCAELGVPFGCQSGQCATCIIVVEEGLQNLANPNEVEEDMRLRDNERLACQAWIKSGTVKATW